jgi:NhaA family Na+:H+ antiporter
MATDIAFALAVLAIIGRRLPIALRAFLLTLAVVDDLGAITVIAVFYSHGMHPWWLVAAIALFAAYALAQRMRVRTPFLYVPLGLLAWYCLFQSGVHATIAGVVLGLLTRVRTDPGESASPVDRLSHLLHPLSAGVCVPIFAFLAAGVDVRSIGMVTAFTTPVALGVVIGLVVGKPIGVLAASWATARFTRAHLSADLRWRDVLAVGLLAGIGFTVALLIAGLAFADDPELLDSAKAAVLAASVIAALVATVALRSRNRHYAALPEGDGPEHLNPDGRA